jgi:hypothetical protein
MQGELMREFETANYRVRVTAEPELDLDLSWDETGEVRRKLDTGEYIAFVAHAEVIHKPTGTVLGEDYLGNCIYSGFGDFMDHRACGRQNREWEASGEEGRCGSYFAQMISDAIAEAREASPLMQIGRLREAR